MSRYTLSINIKSDSRELLDSLMVTLETINGDLNKIEAVELFTAEDEAQPDGGRRATDIDPTTTQRDLFLDKWVLAEASL